MVDIEVEDLGVRVANLQVRAKPGEKKHSGFFITINTNFRPSSTGDAEECAEKLREAVKDMLQKESNLKSIVKFLDGQEWSTDTIVKVSSEFVVERGRTKRGGRIHSHVALHIDHKSKIHLDIDAIKGVILPYFEGV